MNALCKLLQIQYPIIQGGMGNISNAILTAAVSEAGGLGTIGAGTMKPEEVEEIIIETKRRTNKPFSVNIAITVTPYAKQLVELVIKHEVPVVTLSAGNPGPIIPLLKEHNQKVIVVVASVKHAKKAEEAGADVLVAEGYEAAGINSSLEITTFTLIPQIVKNVNVPVVAAGGVGDGHGLLAALALGASGVQMGTRFIATQEAPFHDTYKTHILQASDTDTMILGRSVGKVRRVLKNNYAANIVKKEQEGMLPGQYDELTSEAQHILGALEGNMEAGFINGGQISGLISNIPSVKELLDSMMKEASGTLQELHTMFYALEKERV
ncbi:NAD(P)H-dependent flavin oxidoreductase [Microbacteriaceae bacterium 4G12]